MRGGRGGRGVVVVVCEEARKIPPRSWRQWTDWGLGRDEVARLLLVENACWGASVAVNHVMCHFDILQLVTEQKMLL